MTGWSDLEFVRDVAEVQVVVLPMKRTGWESVIFELIDERELSAVLVELREAIEAAEKLVSDWTPAG